MYYLLDKEETESFWKPVFFDRIVSVVTRHSGIPGREFDDVAPEKRQRYVWKWLAFCAREASDDT